IIGSGPAGITISIILAQRGYRVTLFESRDYIGGVLRYGIPEFRLPKAALEKYREKLVELGVKIRPNTVIGHGGLVIDDLFRDGYKAIFIGTGVWKPNALGIEGESLGHVHFAINYLKNPAVYDLGERVAIIGAGNAAMDVARTAIRKGTRQVTVFFLMGEEQLTANRAEVAYAKVEGVQFEYFKQPVKITDDGVIFADTRLIDGGDGGAEFERIPNTERLYEADNVIVSISQGPRNYIVSTTDGIEADGRGLLVTDAHGRTTREGIFASGDVVSGARTVVEAVSYSKSVADAMEEYIRNAAENPPI
ncbi:MAG: FAD-dependent oxidoreductase, partial [Clostridiales bacterium]|nr:FAD-dependent oxidoreductase [Clostridiales bacterium]